MKHLLSCLVVVLLLAGGPAARACRYCEMAAADPESNRLSAQVGGQTFPLEGMIGQYPPATPAAPTTPAPSPAASVATRAADLPAMPPRPAATLAAAPVVQSVPMAAVAVAAAPSGGTGRWADAGLVMLAAVGALFFWRTRRPTVSAS